MAAAGGGATAQVGRADRYTAATGPSRRAPVAPAVAPDWSGKSGASGHPTHDRGGDPRGGGEFPRLPRAAVAAGGAARHFARGLRSLYRQLTPDLRIMDLLDNQPEFTKSFWDYLDILVNDDRIAHGRALLENIARPSTRSKSLWRRPLYYRRDLGRGDQLRRIGGDRPVLRSTATLACVGRRQQYFRDEFLSALEILHRGDVKPDRLVGSWAGAFGPTQFMPTAFKRYAVDFDRDGHRDVVDSIPDMIASTANNLKKDGWVAGRPGATRWWCRRISISCWPTTIAR